MSDDENPRRRFRVEVQALRAAAIVAVIGYHFWPGRLPGGYLGVDVFFVISGFLITGHLLGELERHGRVSFAAFYARRARRILPAALLVLAACLAVTLALGSVLDWQGSIGQILASTLFVQNWWLAIAAVDYLGATAAPTLVQHYWSLSVEEQFYLLWPAVLVGLFVLARRASPARQRTALIGGLAVIAALSLALWLLLAASDPAVGFFHTAARAWQFAAGGLLAAVGSARALRPGLRIGLGMLGWALIAVSTLLAPGDAVVTAAVALVPVVGAVLVIGAGVPDTPSWWGRMLSFAPIRVLAEISFAAYLWHWPVLLVAEQLADEPLSTPVRLALVALTLVLAWATTRWVENPVRFGLVMRAARPRAVLVASVAAIALVAVPAVSALVAFERVVAVTVATAGPAQPTTTATGRLCVGAEALDPDADCVDGPYTTLVPNPLGARGPISMLHDLGCANRVREPGFLFCEFGDTASTIDVALVGDSKAMKMFPAMERLAIENGWRLVVYAKGGCAYRLPDARTGDPTCAEFREQLTAELDQPGAWDLIVTMGASFDDPVSEDEVAAVRDAWQPLRDNGVPIAVIRDNPWAGDDPRGCVLDNLDDLAVCDLDRETALRPDAQVIAARGLDDVIAIDLSDFYCTEAVCPMAIGGVLVYRDAGHVNDEYTRTLAPYIAPRLERLAPELFSGR